MTAKSELPVQVVDAIHANRKIDAIKLLREERGLGLKEAKELVDAYTMKNPQLVVQRSARGSGGKFILIIAIAAAAYAAYRFLT